MYGPERLRPRAVFACCAALLAGALSPPAHAVLGEDEASIHADQLRSGAVRRQTARAGLRVHTLTLADGSTITQYLGADGLVFAVAWNTRLKPRLDQLLGSHFTAYAESGREAQRLRPGMQRHAVLQRGDLVVESSTHLNVHVGRAWLRSRLPAGTPVDALR